MCIRDSVCTWCTLILRGQHPNSETIMTDCIKGSCNDSVTYTIVLWVLSNPLKVGLLWSRYFEGFKYIELQHAAHRLMQSRRNIQSSVEQGYCTCNIVTITLRFWVHPAATELRTSTQPAHLHNIGSESFAWAHCLCHHFECTSRQWMYKACV